MALQYNKLSMSAVPGSSWSGVDHLLAERATDTRPDDEEDDVIQAFDNDISGQWYIIYEAAGGRTYSGQRSSPYSAFHYKRSRIFRGQVAGKHSVDTVEDNDFGAKVDTEPDVDSRLKQ
ncbi:hypothetical protein FN846DRAFT_896418 [Sphaerosporella brunnea]|uniref:Uncharacterized protein n=1 Tax=Sphaerosporella brunnea TaxID=1250544 RepID=A0A5J5ECX5_9PEZI|nr:hypothetical protein FN846DRAFT_896418 [Sphaerosporella brunnea]